MILRELCRHLEAIAPPQLAADWDNVGLLAGDPATDVRRGLLTIDLTDAVLDEAIAVGCQLVIAYHPAIFKPLPSITADGPASRVFRALRAGVAIYSMHTALDAATDGTNDAMCRLLHLRDVRPIEPFKSHGRTCKLVVFAPADAVDGIADAMSAAGAGRLGNYRRCSFRAAGLGTFQGGDGANPAVGSPGAFERVDEVRLEMIAPALRLPEVVAALRVTHPYETPAFDIVPLHEVDERVGMGRIGCMPSPGPLDAVVRSLKAALGVEAVWLAAPVAAGPIARVAVGAGSCGDLYRKASAAGADLYITGELRHHDALDAVSRGLAVVTLRHSVSERMVLRRVGERLAAATTGVSFALSTADADPYRWS